MIQGSTTEFKFYVPCDFSEIESIKITFWQDDYSGPSEARPLPIVKIKEQCETPNSPKEICCVLNQEETLRFCTDRKAYVQFRATTYDGVSYATKAQKITVYPVYGGSIIDEGIIPTPEYDGLIVLDGLSIDS